MFETVFDVGVMFWAGEPVEKLTALGFRQGQMGVPGDFPLETFRPDLEVKTVFAAFTGEDYADIGAVERTVGFVPPATREERERRMLAVSDFARAMGAGSIATHIGCIAPGDVAMRDLVRRICDHAARHSQSFALETGQEPAAELLRFIEEVDRPNLGINFDPANMVLYGSGDPVEALGLLGKHVLSVHCKDGGWPAGPGLLGVEKPLGEGAVDFPRWLAKLQEIGYKGPLFIEREASDAERRLRDIAAGLEYLRGLGAVTG